MNRTLLFISLFSIFILVSCQSSPKNEAGKQNEVELVAEKQLAFPLDEHLLLKQIHVPIRRKRERIPSL